MIRMRVGSSAAGIMVVQTLVLPVSEAHTGQHGRVVAAIVAALQSRTSPWMIHVSLQ
jgi:hypothetical protein